MNIYIYLFFLNTKKNLHKYSPINTKKTHIYKKKVPRKKGTFVFLLEQKKFLAKVLRPLQELKVKPRGGSYFLASIRMKIFCG